MAVATGQVVTFGTHTYPYYLESGPAWPDLLPRLQALDADRFLILTDSAFPTHISAEAESWVSRAAPASVLTFESSERAKTFLTLAALAEAAIEARVTRRSCIIALGGGLVGNVGGLLAALLFRGTRLIHIPTTLLAMSDSVLSLKQAINSNQGKNHLGTFYAPEFVWTDLSFLDSLPRNEIKSALCELIKNVVAICPEEFANVAGMLNTEGTYSDREYTRFIELCLAAKGEVMRDDPYEKGAGLVLEYGHTVGHALELVSHGGLPHGFAVGLGMLVEARISNMMGFLSRADEQVHRELLSRNGAPIVLPASIAIEEVAATMALDNKRGYVPGHPSAYDMVLLERLGRPHLTGNSLITQVPHELLEPAMAAITA